MKEVSIFYKSRYLKEEKSTLHTLADKYGVSAERVRQLENKAIKKLKERLEGQINLLTTNFFSSILGEKYGNPSLTRSCYRS